MKPIDELRGWKRTAVGVVRYAIGFGLLYVVLRSTGGIGGEQGLLNNPVILAVFAAQALVGAGVEAIRLDWLLRSQGLILKFLQGYRLVAVGTFFNFAIPGGTGGDVMKLYYLVSDQRHRGIEVATVLLVDRIMGLTSLLLIAMAVIGLQPTLLENPGVRALFGMLMAMLLAVGALFAVALSEAARQWKLVSWVTTTAPLHRYSSRLSNALWEFRDRKRSLLAALGISMVGQVLLAFAFGLAGLILMGSSIPATGGLSLVALLANALPITPGGLGVGEAAFQGLFQAIGYAGGAQLVLAWRIGLLPLAAVGALLYARGVRRSGTSITQELSKDVQIDQRVG